VLFTREKEEKKGGDSAENYEKREEAGDSPKKHLFVNENQ